MSAGWRKPGTTRRRIGIELEEQANMEGDSRLNPTDATLWEIQRDPELRTTIVALAVLDRRPTWEDLVAAVARCVASTPKLRQRVVEGPLGLGRPRWQAQEPDLGVHLRRTTVPEGSGLRPVLDICATLAGEGFDPDRPLWEMVVVDGWDEERAALVLKVSHTVTDGLGGMNLLRSLSDGANRTPVETSEERRSSGGQLIALPRQVAGTMLTSAAHPTSSVRSVAAGVGSAARLIRPSGPPLSSLTSNRGLDRWVGVSDIPLQRLEAAAHRAGGTLNDAFLTIGLRALTEYHRSFGADISVFRVTMPISFRSESDDPDGNQWTPARLVLRSDLGLHPFAELASHRARVHRARAEPSVSFSQTMAAALHELPSSLTIGIVGGMAKGSDLVMTDVPGLREPLTIGGSSVDRLYGFAPATGAALNISLVSHLDEACIGFTVDVAAIADPGRLVAAFDEQAADFLRRRKAPAAPAPTTEPEEDVGTPTDTDGDDGEDTNDGFDRLSALDMSFLRMETTTAPMHMGGLFVFDGRDMFGDDGALDIDEIRRHVEVRLAAHPRLAKKVKEVPLELGRPVWVDDPQLDLRHHVRTSAIAAPGGWPELLAACEQIQMQLLDRERPLFELHFLTGLDSGVFGSDAVALVDKVHHALLDGISGVESLSMLFDLSPTPAPGANPPPASAPPGRTRSAAVEPSALRLALSGIAQQAREPRQLLVSAVEALRHPRRLAADLATVAWAIGDLVDSTARPSMNREPLGPRRLLHPVALPLEEVRETGHQLGGTINDVALTAIGRGLRTFFDHRGEEIHDRITALVPVSTRRSGLETDRGNHVAALIVELPVGETDLGAAFTSTATQVHELKSHSHAHGSDLLLEAADHLPPLAIDVVARAVSQQPFVNLVVTNLPGPPSPLYYRHGQVRHAIPIVPLGGNLSLSVAILSYCDDLTIAFHADADACDDVAVLAEATLDAFHELATMAGVDTAGQPAQRRIGPL